MFSLVLMKLQLQKLWLGRTRSSSESLGTQHRSGNSPTLVVKPLAWNPLEPVEWLSELAAKTSYPIHGASADIYWQMIPWETGSSEKQVNLDFPTSVKIVAWPGRINTHPVPLLSFKKRKKKKKNPEYKQVFVTEKMLLGLWGASKQSWSHWRWKWCLQLWVSIWCYSDSGAEVKTALDCNLRTLVLKTDLPMKLPLRSTNLNQLPFGACSPANLTVSYRMQLSACIARA